MGHEHYLETLGIAVYRQRAQQPVVNHQVFRLCLQGSLLQALLFCGPVPSNAQAQALLEKMLAAAGFEAELLADTPKAEGVILVMGDLQISDKQINLPHPALLLVQPELKRDAWETLKSVVKSLKA